MKNIPPNTTLIPEVIRKTTRATYFICFVRPSLLSRLGGKSYGKEGRKKERKENTNEGKVPLNPIYYMGVTAPLGV
jgi:hypothetical protein